MLEADSKPALQSPDPWDPSTGAVELGEDLRGRPENPSALEGVPSIYRNSLGNHYSVSFFAGPSFRIDVLGGAIVVQCHVGLQVTRGHSGNVLISSFW